MADIDLNPDRPHNPERTAEAGQFFDAISRLITPAQQVPGARFRNYPVRPCGYCGALYQERPRVRTCSRKCGASLRALESPKAPSGGLWPSESEVAISEARRREAIRTSLDSGATREIPLHGTKAAARVAFVDAADYGLVAQYRWTVLEVPEKNQGPYAIARVGTGRKAPRRYMHQLLTGNPRTDHHNHDGLDNRRENLRQVTPRQNLANQRPTRRGSSRYKGVVHRRDTGRWSAGIKTAEGHRALGCYDTEMDAALAYDVAARQYFGEFACPNLPEGLVAMAKIHMDGPHTPETVHEMAADMAEGTRYLCYATRLGAGGLVFPADAYVLLGELYSATGRLPQICDQLGEFLADQRATGRLYEARGRDVGAQVTAARIHLTDAASAARTLTRALQAVQADIAGLGVTEDPDA